MERKKLDKSAYGGVPGSDYNPYLGTHDGLVKGGFKLYKYGGLKMYKKGGLGSSGLRYPM